MTFQYYTKANLHKAVLFFIPAIFIFLYFPFNLSQKLRLKTDLQSPLFANNSFLKLNKNINNNYPIFNNNPSPIAIFNDSISVSPINSIKKLNNKVNSIHLARKDKAKFVKASTIIDTVLQGSIRLLVSASHLLTKDKITISKRVESIETPALEYGMENVTSGDCSYQIKGLDGRATKVALGVDLNKLHEGYTIDDVYTYWYDKKNKHWVQLPRESINLSTNTIHSATNKDGDYINGVIKAPESPETQGYMPTTMSDVKAADPASMVQIIQPPVANNKGSANLSYHIEIPKGRQGIEPDLNIVYSSDGSNGWLGEGWDLSGISTITVETRWGVPKYEPAIETETYLLDGQMLAMEDDETDMLAHRTLTKQRQGDSKFFHPRKESNFSLIERKGTKPGEYSWVMTDKKGTKYFYGSSDQSRLSTTGKIAEWKIDTVRDVFGNYMNFNYKKDEFPLAGSIPTVAGEIYLQSIQYNSNTNGNRNANYQINFTSKDKDRQAFINARYGFLTVNRQFLSKIEIGYNNTAYGSHVGFANFRSYEFEDTLGEFNKLLLKTIIQKGEGGKEFNRHSLRYCNKIEDGKLFEEPVEFTSHYDKLNSGITSLPLPINEDKPSAINNSKSTTHSGRLYVGIGPNDWNLVAKNNTVGIRGGYATTSSKGLNTLVDIDGDGLPDEVFVDNNGSLKFHKNLGHDFEKASRDLIGAPSAFSESNTTTFNVGLESNFGIAAGFEYSKSNSTTSVYFADVNADGLQDLVFDGKVWFNHLFKEMPVFSLKSDETYVPVSSGNIVMYNPSEETSAKNEVEKKRQKLIENNPLLESVRMWEAPFAGIVNVKSIIKQNYIDTTGWQENKKSFEQADGLSYSIQVGKGGTGASTFAEGAMNLNDSNPSRSINLNDIKVESGTKIFFRLQSSKRNDGDGDGNFDQINWQPEVVYVVYKPTEQQNDVFKKNKYRYSINEDFLVTNTDGAFIIPTSGILDISGELSKNAVTGDSVQFQIIHEKRNAGISSQIKNPIDTILVDSCKQYDDGAFSFNGNFVKRTTLQSRISFKIKNPEDSISIFNKSDSIIMNELWGGNDTLSKQMNYSLSVDSGDVIRFMATSPVNIGWDSVLWKPIITLKKGTNQILSPKFIVPSFQFNGANTHIGAISDTLKDSSYVISSYIKFKDNYKPSGEVNFAVRNNNKVLHRQKLVYAKDISPEVISSTHSIVMQDTISKLYASFENPAIYKDRVNDSLFAMIDSAFLVFHHTDSFPGEANNITGKFWSVPTESKYVLNHKLSFLNVQNRNIKYEILQGTTVAGQGFLNFNNSKSHAERSDTLDLASKAKINIRYIIPATAMNPGLDRVQSSNVIIDAMQVAEVWTKRWEQRFGPMYRNWGQFVYNGNYGRASAKINETDLEAPPSLLIKGEADKLMNGVQGQIGNQDVKRDPVTSSMDKLNPLKAAFSTMQPLANDNGEYYWQGVGDSVYAMKQRMSATRFGLKHIEVSDPFLNRSNPGNNRFLGIEKKSSTKSWTFNAGYKGFGGTYATGSSETESDYIDLNGDRFPDFIGTNNVLFTKPNGSLGESKTINHLQKSDNTLYGIGEGGIYPAPNSIYNEFIAKKNTASANASEAAGDGAEGAGKESINNVGNPVTGNYSSEDVQISWMDINGDGLPDKLIKKGKSVQPYLNLGNGTFTPGSITNWGLTSIMESSNISLSPNIPMGFSIANGSIRGGVGISLSHSIPDLSLQDLNGDGLVDITQIKNGNLYYQINNGTNYLGGEKEAKVINANGNLIAGFSMPSFINNVPLIGDAIKKWNSNFNTSLSKSLSATFTLGIPIPACIYPCIKISIGEIGYNYSYSLGKTYRQIMDINGDGFPDILESDEENDLKVRYSKIAGTNKLETVINPLGGTFNIVYVHNPPTQYHPGGKWVMKKLVIDDGTKEDGPIQIDSFAYAGGKYDRYEREFLGFQEVKTMNMLDGNVYRKQIKNFDTDNYYVAGNLRKVRLTDSSEKKIYTYADYHYFLKKVRPVSANTGKYELSDNQDTLERFYDGISFSIIDYAIDGNYEAGDKLVAIYKAYGYDSLGNITSFYYDIKDINPGISYQYHTAIKYKDFDPATKIFGLAQNTETKIPNGTVVRKSKATYNPQGKPEAVSRLIDGARYTTLAFTYNLFGNIITKTLPENEINQSVKYEYAYDNETESFIEKVKQLADANTADEDDGFNFISTSKYDKRFGIDTFSTDIHGKDIKYKFDQFGRIVSIKAPKESAKNYTIKFEYPDFKHAITTHFDEDHSTAGIQTINFIDGFKRSIQVKKTAEIEGKPNETWIVSGRTNYDALGRAVQIFYPTSQNDIDKEIFRADTAKINPSKYTYDKLDRVIEIKMPDTLFSRTSYSVIAGNLVQADTLFNNTGNQLKEKHTNGSGLVIKELYNKVPTTYEYDPILQLSGVIDYNNVTLYKYEYDKSGRKTQTTSIYAGITKMEYDNAGNLITKINSNGKKIEYKYDYNRLVNIHYPTDTLNDVKYVYGYGSSGTGAHQRGRIIYQEDASGAQNFTYDDFGNIETNKRTIISPFDDKTYTFETKYEYDSWGRMQKMTYSDNDWLDYQYNKGGQLDAIIQHRPAGSGTATIVEHIGYDEFEQKVLTKYGNKTKTTYTYDLARRRMADLNVTAINGADKSTYKYDNQNNIESINTAANFTGINVKANLTNQYKYDAFNRIKYAKNYLDGKITNTLNLSYNDDYSINTKTNDYVNLLDKITRNARDSFSYNDQKQLSVLEHQSKRKANLTPDYTDTLTEKYRYDQKGNDTLRLTSNKYGNFIAANTNKRHILWDDENRIRSINLDGLVSSYIYDGEGNRTIKISTRSMGTYVNGVKGGDTTVSASFSLYANPYFSMRNGDGLYSKHIYIGTQRICSQIENQGYFTNSGIGEGGAVPSLSGKTFCKTQYNEGGCNAIPINYTQKVILANAAINSYFNAFDLSYKFVDAFAFVNKPKSKAEIKPDSTEQSFARYYYHSNQVSSTSMVSDNSGNVIQYAAYLPFGETFYNKTNTTYTGSQFLFNGKEQDQETGLYYYGARYYDPHTYQWLGVDPMAEKYPGLSPYNFNLGNPVSMIDVDGRATTGLHYLITYGAALSEGYSFREASQLGYYSSTYSDGPKAEITFLNYAIYRNADLLPNGRPQLDESQTNDFKHNQWHCMKTDEIPYRSLSNQEAVINGLSFANSQFEKGKLTGKIEDFALGIHTIQDCNFHKGISNDEHLDWRNNRYEAIKNTINDFGVNPLDIYKSFFDTKEKLKEIKPFIKFDNIP